MCRLFAQLDHIDYDGYSTEEEPCQPKRNVHAVIRVARSWLTLADSALTMPRRIRTRAKRGLMLIGVDTVANDGTERDEGF
jgi:hypothetical protein